MKKLKIIVLLLIPIFGFGQSNTPPASVAPAPLNGASMSMSYSKDVEMNATTFTAPVVNEPQIGTFQKRSVQKLKDFYNYLTIISNPKFDKTLRENAKTQAKQLFYGEDCRVNGKKVGDLIDSCFNMTKAVEWKAEDISVSQEMTPSASDSSAGGYRGELSFKESCKGATVKLKKAQIVLSKSEKMFGESKREVWIVFICNIE